MKPVTVGDLLKALDTLPLNAPIYFASWNGVYPLDLEAAAMLFRTAHEDGDIRLVIDDGEAFHKDEKEWKKIFKKSDHEPEDFKPCEPGCS